jgi:hypothetical protein
MVPEHRRGVLTFTHGPRSAGGDILDVRVARLRRGTWSSTWWRRARPGGERTATRSPAAAKRRPAADAETFAERASVPMLADLWVKWCGPVPSGQSGAGGGRLRPGRPG